MSSFLCFICHSTVNADTNEEIREKYREVVGMNECFLNLDHYSAPAMLLQERFLNFEHYNTPAMLSYLCMDSHLCHICCHVLNKLWLFRAICLKRSLEYPVLFSERGTLNLQRNDLEIHTICIEDVCSYSHFNKNANSKSYHLNYECTNTSQNQDFEDNQYVELMEEQNGVDQDFIQNESIANENVQTINRLSHLNDNASPMKEDHANTVENLELETDYANTDNFDTIDNEDTDNFDPGNDDTDNFDPGNEDTDNFDPGNDIDTNIAITPEIVEVENTMSKERKSKKASVKKKKSKRKSYEKIILTIKEQKVELEGRRKEKKYIEAEFKCYNCAIGFLFKDSYQAHMMRHEESNGEYRCPTCTLRFATPAVLRAHAATHGERYACARCGRRVGRRARDTHARRCWGVTTDVACHLCGKVFKDSAGLQQHLKRFHLVGSSRRAHVCSVCGNTYGKQAALRTHMIKHINQKFPCDHCSSIFSSPYTLAQHKKKHSAIQTVKHVCEICDRQYSSRKSLLAHKRNALNHQQTIFECPICSRISPNRRALASHIESVHSASKDYACPHCPARYSNRKSLVRHIGSHSGKGKTKKAVCHLCGASFMGASKLNRHLKKVCVKKEEPRMDQEFVNLYDQSCLNPG